MPGREWDRSKVGPRSAKLPLGTDDIGDPANGEKVKRCAVCGMPEGSELRGLWNGLHVRLTVCERCVFRYNPPDPLDVRAA